MSKVSLSYGGISSNGINSLDNAINSLNTVINFLQAGSIPTDFNQYNNLVNTIADLKKQRDKVIYLKDWIINSNKDYDSFITKLEGQSFKLPTCCIKHRSSTIR